MVVLGSIEVGFLYTTIVGYLLMTVAYYEMIKLQARQEKEDHIQIKTKWVEWFYFLVVQFYMVPRTWCTQELLYNSGVFLPIFVDDMLYKYHSFYCFCLLAAGMILFVLSLEEGFYAYQFKQMGWSLLNLMVIVTSGHGLLLGLWRVRIWFVYTILCMVLRDTTNVIVSNLIPVGPSMH